MIIQNRSLESVISGRNAGSNIFQEIQILKEKNEDLRKEIDNLEDSLGKLNDQSSVLEAIEGEIAKFKKLSGDYRIYGRGLEISVNEELDTTAIVDLVNEFYSVGAEAVSVNGYRITNAQAGFESLPRGEIMLRGQILSPPYVFAMIGESYAMKELLELPGGILDRIEGVEFEIKHKDVIPMN
ncbi:DUF881 domain-containing protein [Candidatus Gracilibacteria bacterium]|nr:DUF881 domain-containing protein [Candidatus Gracilibacteria bacterium]